MQNVSFAHIKQFQHRHFPDAGHDFLHNHPQDFLRAVTLDMAVEASRPAFAAEYISKHRHSVLDAMPACANGRNQQQRGLSGRQKLWRTKDNKSMPQHFYIDHWHRSDYDRGERAFGWAN